MGCVDENTVLELLEGRLAAERRVEIDAHLDRCDACRQLLAHAADALLPTAADSEPPALLAGVGLEVGTRLGRYRVTCRLGAGAMGVVYAAEHLDLKRPVALKVVRSEGDADERQLSARLLREARAASAVRHPNVVTVHDVFELADGSPVMVMDLLEGETLRSLLEREGRLDVPTTIRLMTQVLAGLEAAHALGIVHRDLKPDNVFVGPRAGGELEVRIVDFGIAKLTALEGPTAVTAGLTETGMLVGTPHYMAPEQAFGEAIDERIDLWAVGVMLYECVGGRRPIEGDNIGQLLKRLARLSIEPLDELAPVPPALARLVHELLSERSARPGSAGAVRQRLEAIDPQEPAARVYPTGALPPPRDATSDIAGGGFAISKPGSWVHRLRRRPAPAALGVVALASAVVVALAYQQAPVEAPLAPAAAPVEAAPEPEPLPPPSPPAPPPSAAPPVEPPPAVAPPLPRAPKPPPAAAPSASMPTDDGPGKLITRPPF